MTPRRFFTTTGKPFPYTVLDERAGILQPRGCYQLAEDNQKVPHLEPATFASAQEKALAGQRLTETGDHLGAYHQFIAALNELPEPRSQWNATGWLLLALGENSIRAGNFPAAKAPLADAMWCPGCLGNPWAHLRLGQVRYELNEKDRAADELARAYMGGGREIFEGQDPKYFALVEEVLDPPPGMDRLP